MVPAVAQLATTLKHPGHSCGERPYGFFEAPEKSLLPLMAQAVTEKGTFEVSLLSLSNESSQKTSL